MPTSIFNLSDVGDLKINNGSKNTETDGLSREFVGSVENDYDVSLEILDYSPACPRTEEKSPLSSPLPHKENNTKFEW